jgi:Glu-tRNA(Gln) amidotransferase subunit E-like FAD-binding protein
MQDFTEAEDNLWRDVIQALERGAIARKTANKLWKSVEKTNESRGIIELLKKNFSLDEFSNDEVPHIEKPKRVREVILSEHFL